jgi:hypothetical protein
MKTMDTRRWIYLIALIGLLIATKYFQGVRRAPVRAVTPVEELRNGKIVYTKHAECRMECRKISEEEVEEALATGRLNLKKSDPSDQPCPTYALEDHTADGQLIRVIFAGCEDVVKVVTAIDLGREHSCDCR